MRLSAAWPDPDLVIGMSADIDAYVAALNCKCEALCTCDDTEALKAAMNIYRLT